MATRAPDGANKPWKALDDKAPKLPSSSRQEQWVPTDHVHKNDGGKHGGDERDDDAMMMKVLPGNLAKNCPY